jgi:hypothetical protein
MEKNDATGRRTLATGPESGANLDRLAAEAASVKRRIRAPGAGCARLEGFGQTRKSFLDRPGVLLSDGAGGTPTNFRGDDAKPLISLTRNVGATVNARW